MNGKLLLSVTVMFCVGLLVLSSGCATTAPKPIFSQEIPPVSFIAADDKVTASVASDINVTITEAEMMRIARLIKEETVRKAVSTNKQKIKNYEVSVLLTRYEKGNAFARAMLAGLGQIHIDGNVKLFEMPEKKKVGEFVLRKTFAWGGAYGSSTTIEDIEKTFAEGVAAAITGQTETAEK